MAQWGNKDQANNAPKFSAQILSVGSGAAAMASNTTALYDNVTPSAFVSGMTVGVFAATPAELANTSGEGKKLAAPGWQLRKVGTGPVLSISVANASGYANGDVLTVSGGTVNATGAITTNATGGFTTVNLTNKGSGFATSPTVAVANSTGGATLGTGAVFTVNLGGRAGRVTYETLVEISSITTDGADDALLPE